MPDVLDIRRRLYRHVDANPGRYLRERELGIGTGALERHLAALEKAGLATVLHDAHKRFFPAATDRADKRMLAALRQELPRRIPVLVRAGPTSKAHLISALGVAASRPNHHPPHVSENELISFERIGRDAVCEALDPTRILRLLTAYRRSFFDRLVGGFLDGMDAMR